MVRDPFEALLAEFNRRSGGHIGHASVNSYKRQGGKHWKNWVYSGVVTWANTNNYWYESFPDPSTRHVIFYDDLIRHTETELKKVLNFLKIDITKESLKCAIQRKEGLYHRSKKKMGIELYDKNMRKTINEIKMRVYNDLRNHSTTTTTTTTIPTTTLSSTPMLTS